MASPSYLFVAGCPAPYIAAPYIYIICKRAGAWPVSIYRGQDKAAMPLLHRYGHHTQEELCDAPPAQRAAWGVTGTPNPFGHSQHELRDQNGNPIPEWAVGVDAGPNDNNNRQRFHIAARHYGLEIDFPYDSIVEYHHWHFVKEPKADGRHLYRPHVVAIRQRLAVQTRLAMRGHW